MMELFSIERFCQRVRKSQSMTIANLTYQQIKPASARLLNDALLENQSIVRLNLSHTQLSTRELILILDMLAQPKITHLDLSHNRLVDLSLQKLSTALANNCACQELDLSYNRISDVGVKYLVAALANCPRLTKLNLAHNAITARGIKYLTEGLQANRQLIELNLSHNHFACEGAMVLSEALQHHPHLKILHLANCRLDDRALKYLANLSLQSKVNSLELGNNHISDVGVKYLSAEVFGALRNLNLANNDLSEHGIENILVKLKDQYAIQRLVILGNAINPQQVQECQQILTRNNKYYRALMQIDYRIARLKSGDIWSLINVHAEMNQLPINAITANALENIYQRYREYYSQAYDVMGLLCFSREPYTDDNLQAMIEAILWNGNDKISLPTLALLLSLQADNIKIFQGQISHAFKQLKIEQGCHLENMLVNFNEVTGFDLAIPYNKLKQVCEQVPTDDDLALHREKCLIHKKNPLELLVFLQHEKVAPYIKREFATTRITLIEHLLLFSEYYPIYTTTALPASDNEISMSGFHDIEILHKNYFSYFRRHYLAKLTHVEHIHAALLQAVHDMPNLNIKFQTQLHDIIDKHNSIQELCVNFLNWCWVSLQAHDAPEEDDRLRHYLLRALDLGPDDTSFILDGIKIMSHSLIKTQITSWQLQRIILQYEFSLKNSFCQYRHWIARVINTDESRLLAELQQCNSAQQRYQLLSRFCQVNEESILRQTIELEN